MSFLPAKIRLDASTACQLRCPLCPTASGHINATLGSKFLKSRDFELLLKKNPWVKEVELSNWGEIFLNPELRDILRIGFERGVSLSASNGVNLNNVSEEVLESLVTFRLHSMTCSIDGASDETYSVYRQRGNFTKVLSNLDTLVAYKRRRKSIYPLLAWQFIAFKHNEHEIELAREMAMEREMSFNLKLNWDDTNEQFKPLERKELIRKLTGTGVTSRSEYAEKYNKSYLGHKICRQLWDSPQLNADGRVLGCCVNYWGDFGNAFTEGLTECLTNEKMQYAQGMLTGKLIARDSIPCTTCSYYKEMQEHSRWLPASKESNADSTPNLLKDYRHVLALKLRRQLLKIQKIVSR